MFTRRRSNFPGKSMMYLVDIVNVFTDKNDSLHHISIIDWHKNQACRSINPCLISVQQKRCPFAIIIRFAITTHFTFVSWTHRESNISNIIQFVAYVYIRIPAKRSYKKLFSYVIWNSWISKLMNRTKLVGFID